ncbi:Ribonuclease H [Handroanthus impetiginosus]|uniref:Ribonuclease H n=1 Tax=Handroanthus impetiginosus TaxID=429701 RepID=A0A2G9H4N8_9LAMI|nr:Ribonuclease H [Handroanthus impetiginosus]
MKQRTTLIVSCDHGDSDGESVASSYHVESSLSCVDRRGIKGNTYKQVLKFINASYIDKPKCIMHIVYPRRKYGQLRACVDFQKIKYTKEVVMTHHITFSQDTVEEDTKAAPPKLEEGVKSTVDELKEVKLGEVNDPQPIYISAILTIAEEKGIYHTTGSPFDQANSTSIPLKLIPLIKAEISNMVPVRKKNDQICVCVDFRDLNGACSKDDFPLSITELIIDATIGHEVLSFMDGSSGYNQIRMSPEDEELTAFRTPKAKIDAILRMPEPQNIHELKSLEGKLAYLRRFISSLKDVPFEWDEACSNAFNSTKAYLMKPPVLVTPVPGHPLVLYIVAQERSVRALLVQENDNVDHLIRAEWKLSNDLLDEDILVIKVTPVWKMYFYGASHKEGVGARVVFVTSNREVLPYSFALTQNCLDNIVEYQALILGLEMAIDIKQLQLKVYGDSKLVISQLLGTYEVKKPKLLLYFNYAKRLIGWLGDVEIELIPRVENKQAYALAKLISTLAVLEKKTHVTICKSWVVPPIFQNKNYEEKENHIVEVFEIEKKDWHQSQHLIDFILFNILLGAVSSDVWRRATRFIYYKETLYRCSFNGVFLRCLGDDETIQAMEKIYSRICSAHQSGPKLHFWIKRMGYYWSTMVKDCMDCAQGCQACQFHANFIHQPLEPLHPTIALWLFDSRGLDVKDVANFIGLNIIYRCGVPRYVIFNNGKLFYNNVMGKLCQKFGFKRRKSSMYYVVANSLAKLEALDEKRLKAQQKLKCYQARFYKAFNNKVRLRSFQVDDLVLAVRRPIIITYRTGNKFTFKWDGPYVIKEVYKNGVTS